MKHIHESQVGKAQIPETQPEANAGTCFYPSSYHGPNETLAWQRWMFGAPESTTLQSGSWWEELFRIDFSNVRWGLALGVGIVFGVLILFILVATIR